MGENRYSPGTHKLIRHLSHLQNIVNKIPVSPIHVSVWPNSKCNLNCSYCCGRNIEEKNRINELSIEEYKQAIDILKKYGTLAIEFSGVIGEPLLWKWLDEGVDYAYKNGLNLSLITNGILLKKISKETLSKFSWIRISLQSISHAKSIDWENIPTKYNASVIIHDTNSFNDIKNLYEFAKNNNIVIRVASVRPCSIDWENKVRKEVEKYGYPLFFAYKERNPSKGCYMPYIRGAIDWNGNFLPCPSVELNEENLGYIPREFVLCHISNLEKWINENPPHDLGYKCGFCNCGKEENDFIHELLENVEDVDFV
jgi:organic radical activating enzyme